MRFKFACKNWQHTGFAEIFGLFLVSGALIVCFATPLVAEENPLLRCWSPKELKGRRIERFARRPLRGTRELYKSAKFPQVAKTKQSLRGSIRRVKLPTGKKLIALTLDLCEAAYEVAGYDGGVIDYLRANKIKATLFVGGKWIETHPERSAQLIADPLFEIGNHGWSHRNLKRTYGKQLIAEIERVQFAYARAHDELLNRACMRPSGFGLFKSQLGKTYFSKQPLGKPRQLKLFRFPFGTCSKPALKAVHDHGLLAIQWDVVTGDPAFGQSARRIASVVLSRTKPGSIIIAHANGRGHNTARALPLLIPKLLARGFKFVTVSELLASGTPEVASTCYENRPGDNQHY